MRALTWLGIALAALAVAGAAVAATLDPKKLVLRRSDVPAGFSRTYAGVPKTPGVHWPRGARKWSTTYARTNPSTVQIESDALVYASTRFGRGAFRSLVAGFNKGGKSLFGSSFRTVTLPRFGSAQHAWSLSCDGSTCPSGTAEAFVLVNTGRVVWRTSLYRTGTSAAVANALVAFANKQKALVGRG